MTGIRRRLRRTGPEDPRARELVAACWLLYQEMEASDQVAGVCLHVLSGGQFVTYGLHAGDRDIQRTVYDMTDRAAVEQAVEAMQRVTTDATVAGGPP